MSDAVAAELPPEPRLNELLRAVDWRFLLRRAGRPTVAVLSASADVSEALALVADPAGPDPGSADLAVVGFPSRRRLGEARAALRPGGDIVCLWRRPRIAGVHRARAALRRAGFEPASFHWPGPHPYRQAEFWLPLDSPDAIAHMLAQRPPRSVALKALRALWLLAARIGALAPMCGIARLPDPSGAGRAPNGIDQALGDGRSLLLLTEGTKSRHKVLCFNFAGGPEPAVAVKCSRVAAADRSLEEEAGALSEFAELHPNLDLAPRVRAEGERVGRRAIAESVVPGRLPDSPLTHAAFAALAPRVTRCLVELVDASRQPSAEWHRRLVAEPLERFKRLYGESSEPGTAERAAEMLADLPDLPLAWQHGDLAVWNMHVDPEGSIRFFDWTDSDPRALPGLDLAYFLATSAFMIDRIEMSEPSAVLESHEPLLDPTTPRGAVAASCANEYCEALDLDPGLFALLRLRAWIVKAGLEKDPAAESFARLATAEVRHLDRSGTIPT
jgi:hypothetical protein